MSKNKRKKTVSDSQLFNWMDTFKMNLKAFVDQPTDKNLQNMMHIAEAFKDDWIKIVSRKGGLGDKKPSNLLTKAFLSDLNNELANEDIEISEDKNYDYELTKKLKIDTKIGAGFLRQPEPQSHHTWVKKNLIKHELARAESPDKRTKLLTYSMYLPEYVDTQNEFKSDEHDFIHHSIRAIRNSKDQESDRILNRRWYFEQSKGKKGKIAWWCNRDQFENLIKEANNAELFRHELDDNRLDDSSIKFTFSEYLSKEEQEQIIRHFTLENERKDLLQEDYFFVIAEMHYPKTVGQVINKNFHERKSLWRDILIWSGDKLTIRSVTNDRYYKPAEKIPNSEWVISNDMTSLPNQVLRYFISYLMEPSFKINE